MFDVSGVTNQTLFISKLEESVDDLYATEAVFTLISVEVQASDTRIGAKEVFGLLSKCIKRAIVNKKDSYSFWDNTFYILTYLDNKQVVEDFINSLALTVERRYDKTFFINAGYIQYPYDVIEIKDVFSDLKEKISQITPIKSDIDTGLITDVDYNNFAGKELARYLNLIKQYGDVLYDHSLFVAKVSVGIAKSLKLSKQIIKKIVIASILHDVGYLCIPQRVLVNSEHYSEKTAALVKMHPLLATRKVLEEKTIFRDVFSFIEQHHEYADGTGYPFGLSNKELSMESQIISIADTYDLIRNQRNISNLEIVNFFKSRAGIRWDEKLINGFVEILMDEKQFDNLTNNTEGSLVDFLTWV